MKKLLTILGLLISGYIVKAQQPAFITDSLDIYINREMQRWNIPGVAVAIVKDGKVVSSKGYGVTDIESKKPVDENTLFMIASNTKLFTGTSLALLSYEKRLSLNDKVRDHLPYFKMYSDTLTNMVTIEDILSHRLGFETFQGDFYNWDNNVNRKEIIQNIAKNKPVYDFRDTWGYCNAGFVTAGEIIPAVTDTSWEDFVTARFFKPLDMKRSSLSYDKIIADKNACTPYTINRGVLQKLDYDNLNNIAPCASINSCVGDLTHWLLMQLNTGTYNGVQVIPADAVLDTRLPRSIVSDGYSSLYPSQHFDLYGLGVGMNDYEGREMFWHTGGADGFVTTVCFVPEDKLGVVVLTNSDANYFFIACLYQILESYFDMPYRNLSTIYHSFYERNTKAKDEEISNWYAKADAHPATALELSAYTGKYTNSVYGNMEIKLEAGKLVMYFAHHPQLRGKLQPLGENDFVCTYDPISWGVREIPFTVKDGKVISVAVSVNDFIDYGVYEFIKQ